MESQKYYWLKLKRDFFKRHDIKLIESMPNGERLVLFYLKLLAESVDHNGALRFSDKIPYTPEMLAAVLDTDLDVVKAALDLFLNLEMIEISDDKTIFMREICGMIGSAADNDNARRQREFRERQKSSVTKSNASVTDNVTNNNEIKNKIKSKNIELEKEKDIEKETNNPFLKIAGGEI